MVKANITQAIAEHLTRTRFDNLTDEAVRATKIHILHTLGTIVAGSGAPGVDQILTGVAKWGSKEESTVIVHGKKLPAPSAALVNSTMAHSCELDMNDDRLAYKSSVAVVPAALATAEMVGQVSGEELITAVCLGVDLGIRIGLAINPKPVHALFIALGPFAAAAASSKILQLNEAGMCNSLGVAHCRVAISGNSNVSPSLTKRLAAGFASHSGVLAALLAAEGFPAAGEIFRGPTGFFQTLYGEEGEPDLLLDGLGERYEIVSVGPKPYPSCRYTHPAITAVLAILQNNNIDPEQVEEVRVHVGKRDMHSVCGWEETQKRKRYRPEGVVDAQFSIPYTVAVALLKGKVSLDDFTEASIQDQRVLQFAQRVKPILDPQLDQWPLDVKPQVVEIFTRDSRVYSWKVEYAKGNPRNPVSFDELQENFREMAKYAAQPLSDEKIEKVISFVSAMEEVRDATLVTQLLT